MAAAALEAVAALASEVTHNSMINKKIIQTTWQGKGKPGSHGVGLEGWSHAWKQCKGCLLGDKGLPGCMRFFACVQQLTNPFEFVWEVAKTF